MNDFDKLCKRCGPIVYRYLLSLCCNEALADELTSETFYQAFLHIGQFRGECKIETWLCTIAKNTYFKEQKRNRKSSPIDTLKEVADTENIIDRFHDKEQAMVILKSLHNLDEPYKEVFTLRVMGDLKFKEIAEIFGKTESWAKVTFYRAKAKLVEATEG